MELSIQIKKYRTELHLSQEELAEKVYVTRQTISNWENEKSYPDIHSLLLLSSLFNVSLDQLIKGDIEKMKEIISEQEIKKFKLLWFHLYSSFGRVDYIGSTFVYVARKVCVYSVWDFIYYYNVLGVKG